MQQPANKKKGYIKQAIWRALVIFVAIAMILSMVLPFMTF
jgi:flagellar basal body-associated protein FliL